MDERDVSEGVAIGVELGEISDGSDATRGNHPLDCTIWCPRSPSNKISEWHTDLREQDFGATGVSIRQWIVRHILVDCITRSQGYEVT